MAEYQRLVSYIYLYDKGIKIKNSGFAKIECRDSVLRIKMNLKGAFNNYYEQWKVYLLLEGRKELLGIYVGDMKSKGTSAEFQMSGTTTNMNGTSKSFDDVKGLAVISSGNKRYATFWKDTDITIEYFKEYNEEEDNKKKNILSFIKEKKNMEENERHEKEENEKNEELIKAMSVEKDEKEEECIKEEVKMQENVSTIEKPLETESQTEKEENEIEENKMGENGIKANEAKENTMEQNMWEEAPKDSLDENWDKLIKQYRNINPFSDNDIKCIRIELKDLKILPKSQWVLSSNSFVLHGFYNYHYLILGKINSKFILGVPGVFCNKEKLVAGLFGFDDFKPAQVSDYKTGRFGYWYKYL